MSNLAKESISGDSKEVKSAHGAKGDVLKSRRPILGYRKDKHHNECYTRSFYIKYKGIMLQLDNLHKSIVNRRRDVVEKTRYKHLPCTRGAGRQISGINACQL